jgi:4-cresol dehydrogenase (hydroxylating)
MDSTTNSAIIRLQAIVGEQYVLTDEKELERHSRCTIPWKRNCSAVVYPGSSEEIREILKVAGEAGLSVWPYSTGKNWGYGTTVAAHDGAIILILKRLNRIIEVNEELAYAVIEPGVTYRQLNQHLKENRIKLWCDCTDGPPEGSVIGNALDRGVGATPYHDHFGNLCGMEVILPNGDVIQTGGGPPNSLTSHTYKWGAGPYLEGLFSQSNFGIVTKAGLWLMPEPRCYNSFILELRDERNLAAAIDSIRHLALHGVLTSAIHVGNAVVALAILTQYQREACANQAYLSEHTLSELAAKHGVAPWSFTGWLYGSDRQVAVARSLVRKALAPFGRLVFMTDYKLAWFQRLLRLWRSMKNTGVSSLFDRVARALLGKPLETLEAAPHGHNVGKGIPTEFFVRHAYFKASVPKPEDHVDPVRDKVGLMWFAPVSPVTGRHVTELLALCRPLFKKYQFDFYAGLLLQNPRSMIVLMSIFYITENSAETVRATALYEELCTVTLAAGYPQYRTSVAHMAEIFDTCPEYQNFANSLKSALDPGNILAPGRYGIGQPTR